MFNKRQNQFISFDINWIANKTEPFYSIYLKNQEHIFESFENQQIDNSRVSNAAFFQDLRNDFILRHTWLEEQVLENDIFNKPDILQHLELNVVFKPTQSLRKNSELIEYAHLNFTNDWKHINRLMKKEKYGVYDGLLISQEKMKEFYSNAQHLSYKRFETRDLVDYTRFYQIVSTEIQPHPFLKGHQELVVTVAQFDIKKSFDHSIESYNRHPMLYKTYPYSGYLVLDNSGSFDTGWSSMKSAFWDFERINSIYLESSDVNRISRKKRFQSSRQMGKSILSTISRAVLDSKIRQGQELEDILLTTGDVWRAHLDHEDFLSHSKQRTHK